MKDYVFSLQELAWYACVGCRRLIDETKQDKQKESELSDMYDRILNHYQDLLPKFQEFNRHMMRLNAQNLVTINEDGFNIQTVIHNFEE